ncbi:ankyrin repeat, SAM and basic leucine zipper domain-containing protein 1 isoform X2 [Myripristis murdjan]|uniref:ankyrin repeat, SAM and basic leucine zipper domain-containing protein 1 isoform X2 n=1 Tax=Myripristis murdjan TaxID=586833 RepID=UPI001175E78D|nr:ankyrin repeat, SAM and basic leucine zipper domain-containing protein 1 isoform X2 [Myripristis murdjan]
MSRFLQNAVPAGAESDSSNDEWDIGHPSNKESSHDQDGNTTVPVLDDVSKLKKAISEGDTRTVAQLLDNGMDVETRLGFEWTPLMCAAHFANYDLTKLLLDRGASANFSKDQFTVLMACCTASASEDRIMHCVELLLSRNADPNMLDRSHMTCLMLAARDGYSKVINLLVSHKVEINAKNSGGYTALAIAVQYGREEAVLKLLQLGADKTIKTNDGKSPANLANLFKHHQIARILAFTSQGYTTQSSSSNEETLLKFFKTETQSPVSNERTAKLGDTELFLHGLDLGHLTDIITENDITWSYLLTMKKDDLEKIGITAPEDQQKLLSALQQMHMDSVDLDTLSQLEDIDSGTEELYNFLISLRQQSCHLTETIRDVISRFPRHSSKLVFSLDPKKEAQALCSQLVVQTGDLQKEIICLHNLLCQMDEAGDGFQLPQPRSHSNQRMRLLTTVALSTLGAGLLFLLCRTTSGGV